MRPLEALKAWYERKYVAPLVDARVEAQVAARVEELRAALPILADLNSDDAGWRRLSADESRDLDPVTRDRMVQIAEFLYTTNPLGKRIVEWTKDFVCGAGFQYSAEDPDTKDWITRFWNDPANNLERNIKRHTKNLGLYGELCLPAFVNRYTGFVRLGYISPYMIDSVQVDPGNCLVPIGVTLKSTLGQRQARLKTVIPGEEDALTPEALRLRRGYTDGECFYYAVNQVDSQARGISDLFNIADWIDGYDQSLFAYMDRMQLINNFIWDVLLEGMDEKDIAAWQKKQTIPKPGSIRAHNEKVKWDAVSPDFKGTDTAEAMRMLRNHALGGAGFPEHWFGGGGDVNRATAEAMDDPTFKALKDRQDFVVSMMRSIIDYHIDQGVRRGMLGRSDNVRDYTFGAPEMVTKDQTKIASAIQQVTASLAMALQQKLIDRKNASTVFCNFVSQTGTEVDPDEAFESARKDAVDDAYEDYHDMPSPPEGEGGASESGGGRAGGSSGGTPQDGQNSGPEDGTAS